MSLEPTDSGPADQQHISAENPKYSALVDRESTRARAVPLLHTMADEVEVAKPASKQKRGSIAIAAGRDSLVLEHAHIEHMNALAKEEADRPVVSLLGCCFAHGEQQWCIGSRLLHATAKPTTNRPRPATHGCLVCYLKAHGIWHTARGTR